MDEIFCPPSGCRTSEQEANLLITCNPERRTDNDGGCLCKGYPRSWFRVYGIEASGVGSRGLVGVQFLRLLSLGLEGLESEGTDNMRFPDLGARLQTFL